jgi:hypothetical protein
MTSAACLCGGGSAMMVVPSLVLSMILIFCCFVLAKYFLCSKTMNRQSSPGLQWVRVLGHNAPIDLRFLPITAAVFS